MIEMVFLLQKLCYLRKRMMICSDGVCRDRYVCLASEAVVANSEGEVD